MNIQTKSLAAFTALALVTGSTHAAVVASTNFDGQTIIGNTASNLGWTLDGVADPGSMSAFDENTTTARNLFNGNTTTRNNFAPALNTGNGNTWWRTSVDLTVSAGSNVTLTDVTFDYLALGGAQTPQPVRRSDFTITLYDPSNAMVGTASILDVIDGSNPTDLVPTPVSLVFGSSVALSAPGTYRLDIDGGELGGFNETGNHTAIDNLSINGDVVVAAIPEPTTTALLGLGGLALIFRRRK